MLSSFASRIYQERFQFCPWELLLPAAVARAQWQYRLQPKFNKRVMLLKKQAKKRNA